MTRSGQTKRVSGGPEAERPAKRPYHKPAVRHEQVFETRALTCGKMQATQAGCHYERKVS
jgi:hypothetical protein